MDGRCNILLIDDNDDVRESLRALIEAHGYVVETAVDGHQALERLETLKSKKNGKRVVILLDLQMPGMDGWQFRRELLKDEKLASLPVVLLSGEPDLKRTARTLKAAAHLQKPVSLQKLYGVLDALLAGRRLTRASASASA